MKKILMCIMDGYGISENEKGNAIKTAKPEEMEFLIQNYPHATLDASGESVGLLEDQFGNSEVGHTTIGAGRIVKQSIVRINDYLNSNLLEDENFNNLVNDIKSNHKRVHLMGLFSDGKVHSSMNHFLSLFKELVGCNINDIYFHLITDGRDTKVNVSLNYIKKLENVINELGTGSIATICGRYYAMDRDNKLERTKVYYDLITSGIGNKINSIENAIHTLYQRGVTDEFLYPLLINSDGLIRDGDILIWMNYRTDRAKQILRTFDNSYTSFPTKKYKNLNIYTFLPIDKDIKTINLLSDSVIKNPLGIYLSKLGLTQARIAETEKYAHVTYFFDGKYEGEIENCSKYLIPSLKIKTYDLDPKMSAIEITKKVLECMEKDIDFILVNFANPDMVGHTGNFDATVKAIMTVDACLKKIIEEAKNNFYTTIITADHGNAEVMLDNEGEIVTTHTNNKVPFIITDKSVKIASRGGLSNIAPTILEYMDIAIPKEMKDSKSLLIS